MKFLIATNDFTSRVQFTIHESGTLSILENTGMRIIAIEHEIKTPVVKSENKSKETGIIPEFVEDKSLGTPPDTNDEGF